MSVQRFSDLHVWRRSHELFLALLQDIDLMPRNRGASVLADQVIRSVGSIGANIAEGFGRSKKKYLSALGIAAGEANEAENWLYKLRDAGYLDGGRCTERIRSLLEIQRMLGGLRRAIRAHPDPTPNP